MPPRIEESDIFDASMAGMAMRYGGHLRLAGKVLQFIRWQQGGGPCPFSADKQSGVRGDGTVFAKFRDLNLRHCHLDIDQADPMLAYRVFPGEDRILMLCVTDHRQMFGDERAFWKRVKGLTRGKVFP